MTVYLGPGGYFWGQSEEPVSTVLGSCVSLIAWLPEKQGMLVSHVMLPTAPLGEEGSLRYGDVVLARWQADAKRAAARLDEFQLALVGGSTQVYQASEYQLSVGYKNTLYLQQALAQRGLRLSYQETGGHYHRKLLVDTQNGRFWWQRLGDPRHPDYEEGIW
jgi:chemotaxis protein CheD